jgi:hypothetical protein
LINPRRVVRLLLVLGTGWAGACAPGGRMAPASYVAAPEAATRTSVSDRLYFGRSMPGGATVAEGEWRAFVEQVVTPRFPDGLTMWHAEGQWRDQSGAIVREASFVLELIHPDHPDSDTAVREIADEYKRRFHQQSVMRVRTRVEASF